MNILGHTVKGVLLLGNVGVGIGFLCCAYSPSMSPVAHPILSCAGLFFLFCYYPFWYLFQYGFLLSEICLGSIDIFGGRGRSNLDIYAISECRRNGGGRGVEVFDL